jgi:integrase
MPVRSKRGILFLDFRLKGVRFRQSTELKDTPKNRELAEDWDKTIRHEVRLGTFDLARHFPHSRKAAKPVKSRTFKDAGETWLGSHKGAWAEWTYRKFRDDLQKRIYPELGFMLISEITPLVLRQLRQKLIERPREDGHGQLSNRTISRRSTLSPTRK